ncbi:MAG: sugar ABC transporter permease [Methylobacterium sp.]
MLLVLLPSSVVIALSATDYQFGMDGMRFVGLANYRTLATDPRFAGIFANTLSYVAIVVPSSVAIGLLLAVLLESAGALKIVYRSAFFLPVTSTLVALATAWEVLLHPNFGLVNALLASLGFERQRFLSDPALALSTLAAIGVWKQVGFNVLLFTAGIATIPRDLYEAASVDGADRGWARFAMVTGPMIGPVFVFVTVISLIRAFSEFETVAVLTQGGPIGATNLVLYGLYEEAFRFFDIGLASALAVVFLGFVTTLSLLKTRLLDRWVR